MMIQGVPPIPTVKDTEKSCLQNMEVEWECKGFGKV